MTPLSTFNTLSAKATTGAGTEIDTDRVKSAEFTTSAVVAGGASATFANQVCVDDIWATDLSTVRNTAATHLVSASKRNAGYTKMRGNVTAVTGTVAVTQNVLTEAINATGDIYPVKTLTALSAVATATTSSEMPISKVASLVVAYSCTTGSGDAVTITTSVKISGSWYVIDVTTYSSAATNVKMVEYINKKATAIRVATSAYTQTPAVTVKIGYVPKG